jgi:hypothetical protein
MNGEGMTANEGVSGFEWSECGTEIPKLGELLGELFRETLFPKPRL